MIISVQLGSHSTRRYTYNAPNDVQVGDEVEVEVGLGGEYTGTVTAISATAAYDLIRNQWDGPIKSILGRAPLAMQFEAKNRAELRRKLEDALEDLKEEQR